MGCSPARMKWGRMPKRLVHKKRGTVRRPLPFGFAFGFVSDPVKDPDREPCQKVGKADDHSDRHNLFRARHDSVVLVCKVSTVCHPS